MAEAEPEADAGAPAREDGLTEDGVLEAVRRHCNFDRPLVDGGAPPTPMDRVRQQKGVENVVGHVITTGEATVDELEEFFEPVGVHAPSQGMFVEREEAAWFDQVVAPRLEALPFIEAADDGDVWRFDPARLDPSEYDDEQLQPLEEIRNNPEVHAAAALADLSVDRGSDEWDATLACWRQVRDVGSTTSSALQSATRGSGTAFSSVEPYLTSLPGIEREKEYPPDPEEIEIETYADVLEAEDAVGQEPITQWRYVADSGE